MTDDVYIGIDPGSKNCALVAWSPSDELITTWKPKGTMPSGVLRLRRLMVDITGELIRVQQSHGLIQQIAMEGYSMYERFGQHASGEVGAAIKLAVLDVFETNDPVAYPLLVAPQQLKKFATGNGNTKKELISKEVLKRWGVDFNDTNMAEAYVLARVAHAFDTKPEMPQFQQQVIEKLADRTERPTSMPVSRPHRRLARVGGRGGAKART